ncbi:hypothetical protein L249_7472 [Ophiocordyceps polyrhachis-furcata BCC 54312]|uniref:Uncharacterized protein n=1 Tax=Ophiocordyceps polyrhachis-furcata BCC 54312 TaxID=1330021 RepID=A0A367LAK6_9HYPO|nr:hypothetical protein L249_7472 [Ophiocordyceps polyrhachis-furcata BCC 54312]
MRIRFHVIDGSLVEVFDIAQIQRATAVLIPLKLGYGRFRRLWSVESNHAGTTRPAARLVLDFSLLDLANGGEEFDQVIIACRPRELDSRHQSHGLTTHQKLCELTLRTAGSGVVGKWVGRDRSSGCRVKAASWASSKPATTAERKAATAAAEATTTKAAAAAAAASTAVASTHAAAVSATRWESHAGTSVAVFSHLEQSSLPVVSIKLLDSVSGVIRAFEDDDARALRSAVGADMNIGTDDSSDAC